MSFQQIEGIIKKKGRHAMQGYKDRKFIIDSEGYFRYGPPDQENKWVKKIKLSDLISVDPLNEDPRHAFTITRKDGRVLYWAANNDEEKWKWINGFRRAIKTFVSPEWSPVDDVPSYTGRSVFIPLEKLSKMTVTGIWRWRFFHIDDNDVAYYSDPGLGEELGRFPISSITKAEFVKNKHGKEKILQVDSKTENKRTYYFSSTDDDQIQMFYEMIKPEKKGLFSFLR